MPADAALLTAHGLGCRYRRRAEPSLADVELALVPGEVTLVAGRSASGKTSLLRCLNGLVPRAYPGSTLLGELRHRGRDAAGWSLAALGREVGTLLQDPARQVVGMDVFRELAFGPENLGLAVPEVERRVRAAAARLGLEPLLSRATDALSSGQLQKVALAGVLAYGPEVLLFDEPLAALDPESAHEVAALLRALADGGAAVLVVEHRIEALLAARPDRALLVEAGRVIYSGSFAGWLERADPAHQNLPFDAAVRRWSARRTEGRGAAGPSPTSPPSPDSASSTPLLACEDLHLAYPGPPTGGAEVRTQALAGASFELRAGEIVALLGANGAGKSTLLEHAAGLLRPDRGRVWVRGRDAAELSLAQLSREVGFLFSDPGAMLFADTVRAECLFAPRNQGLSAAEAAQRADAALARMGLAELADEPPRALSLGQQKRVCLAAVASQGARIWMLDEPTAGLDPGGVADLLAALGVVRDAAGRAAPAAAEAVLFATHDVDLALLFASRVLVLDAGRVVADGTPAEVLLDTALLRRARLRSTSLIEANRARLEAGLGALDARAFAEASESERGGERA